MTTLRPTICCILSAILISGCALGFADKPQRIIRVKALADIPLRERNPRWEEEIRGLVEASSDYFEQEFGIRLSTQSTAPWPGRERIPSTPDLLLKLKQDFPLDRKDGHYDLIIAFTAEPTSRYMRAGRPRVDRIGDCQKGLGGYVVTSVSTPFRYSGANQELSSDLVALIHELGHIFGAEHVKDSTSIMNEEFGYSTEFDMKNRNIVLKNKNCHFAK